MLLESPGGERGINQGLFEGVTLWEIKMSPQDDDNNNYCDWTIKELTNDVLKTEVCRKKVCCSLSELFFLDSASERRLVKALNL